MSSYGGVKYFQEKIWGSEIFLVKNMGVWKFCRKKYGGLKKSCNKLWGSEINSVKIWGREIVSGENMGARNIFWGKYGGAKHFLEKGGGAKNFLFFFENSSERVPGIAKDQPLRQNLNAADMKYFWKTAWYGKSERKNWGANFRKLS